MAEQQQQPQVITLDNQNSIEILSSYVELAQKHGSFALPESDILKRCRDLLLKGVQDPEINVLTAKNLFMQAVNKGQSKGAFSLDDAYIVHRVCTYVSANLEVQPTQQQTQQTQQTQQVQDVNDDLSTLSDPVPIKRSGPRTV